MSNYSNKEIEALSIKAAKGAGFSWGLAEEAGFAAAWLASRGLSDLGNFVELLKTNAERQLAEMKPQGSPDCWASIDGRALCPISVGAYWSDCGRMLQKDQSVEIQHIAHPAFLIPFVARGCEQAAHGAIVSWGDVQVEMSVQGLTISGNDEEFESQITESVWVQIGSEIPMTPPHRSDRVSYDDSTLQSLYQLAHRTYVPESEELKNAGAGGEKVDDDE